MKENNYGKIVNIASMTGVVSFLHQSIYAAAKGGEVNLTRELGCELGPFNINVNAICPGIVETPLYEEIDFSLQVKENVEPLLKEIPLNRVGKPDDIAGPAVFLASEDASFMCGSILMADGGWTAH